jgi:tetratricopeptide (TPR) repeat protein
MQAEVGELLLLWARVSLQQPAAPGQNALTTALRLNRLAEACYPTGEVPRALWLQRAELARQLDDAAEAEQAKALADGAPAADGSGLGLLAGQLSLQGQWQQARQQLQEAIRLEPQICGLWANLGLCHEALGQDGDAVACYSTCTALAPDFAPLYARRAAAHLRRQEFALAEGDLSQALRLRPDGPMEVRIRLLRARVREQTGDMAGARRDRTEAMRLQRASQQ